MKKSWLLSRRRWQKSIEHRGCLTQDWEQLILELKADGDADHTETLGMLEQMQGSLSSAITDNLNQINASFSNLDAELKAYFEKLENSQGAGQEEIGNAIGQLGDNLKENQQVIGDAITAHDAANKSGQQEIKDAIGDHNSSVMAGQEGLTNAVKVHDEGIRGYLEEFKGFVTEKLDQVFRFVSNGKKLLASALLTKGVTVAEDASFQEFADGILAVPQKLVIGVEEVPGEIVYEYHYHVDADGTQVGEVATNEKEGGCYTKAVYHTHGNSCYKWTHEHNSTCKSHPIWVDWVPGQEPYWGLIYECGEPPNKRGELICKLPTSDDGNQSIMNWDAAFLTGRLSAPTSYMKKGRRRLLLTGLRKAAMKKNWQRQVWNIPFRQTLLPKRKGR